MAISHYAGDTMLFLDEDKKCLKRVMSLLRLFKAISGLSIHVEKTKVIKIGASRDRSLEGKYRTNWTEEFDILGIEFPMISEN